MPEALAEKEMVIAEMRETNEVSMSMNKRPQQHALQPAWTPRPAKQPAVGCSGHDSQWVSLPAHQALHDALSHAHAPAAQILETKVRKLEQLVKLKDAKIQTLMAKLQASGLA